jgi:acetyl-CoA carboxylase biotin carboxyl carrier protein
VKKPRSRTEALARHRPSGQPGLSSVPLPAGLDVEGLLGQTQPIQALIDLLKQNNLIELELERGGFRIKLKRESATPVQPAKTETAPAKEDGTIAGPAVSVTAELAGTVTITSPIVGTFYRSPSPDADPYVEDGDLVKKGQVLCIVEAMKLMNEIESEVDGRITKILVESTKPVEYGQPLFLIDPQATP